MEDMTRTGKNENDATATATRHPIRRHLKWIIPVVVAGALGAAWALLPSNGGDDEAAATAASLDLEEVVITDLAEVTTFSGTLGFAEGDPITSGVAGTLTAAASEGAVISEGDILFTIDDEPVPLLLGDTTVWRDMGYLPELEALAPRISGTVTWIAEEGATLQQGDILMKVDDQPVVVLYGDIPAYRSLQRGGEGIDVRQLQDALHALGYDPDGDMEADGEFTWITQAYVEDWQADVGASDDGRVGLGEIVFVAGPFTIESLDVEVGSQVGGSAVADISFASEATEGGDVLALEQALVRLGFDDDGAMTVDGVFDEQTRAAVIAWQASIGADDDGVVSPGEVVFLPQSVRISDRLADPGATVNPGTSILATSSYESVVTVDLPASDQAALEEGDRVVIVLPDNTEVSGMVSYKAETATLSSQGGATFDVIVVLDDLAAAEGLDQAPVDVDVVTDRADGVMAVPVTALVALAEGGYAVEVEQADGSTRLVAVDPGMYADGLVEVTSDGLQAGDRVVAP
ncbi:MAG: peptidoglycan-binding protein [Actinobacteria bacterium]|nr:peptidoglycan-binding protein [Actinomycetota bacterium]